ncbi:MAG: nicotinate-nucleotide--dimethylbenzimidazole phosphoribosyltransferase, partial [Nitrospirae bacterium]|nr:nicotinate-nucleotide--dimethylbenzimidazole phosphoribosyltransferase [Nitrospirota bacterium]
LNFLRGGAAINVLARHAGADVVVVDAGVNYDFSEITGLINKKVVHGTKNMAKGPAMTKDEASKTIELGIALAHEYKEKGYRLFGTGDMGIGNTTSSAAIASVITGKSVAQVTGRGTGIDDKVYKHKISVIEQVISINKPNPKDPIDVLSKVGGAEIGAIAGLCLGAAECNIAVVIDGFISTAGALIAYSINPMAGQYMFAGHRSQEIGHIAMLEYMKLRPILDLDLRLGEGTGAVLAMTLVEAGLKIYREMATFEEAHVSDKE